MKREAPGSDARVAILGLGYVGLPLAIAFVEAGLDVEGIDANAGRLAELSAVVLICEHLRPGQLDVLQSTTYSGTTTGRSGHRVGR